jgi:hypothetical protein
MVRGIFPPFAGAVFFFYGSEAIWRRLIDVRGN